MELVVSIQKLSAMREDVEAVEVVKSVVGRCQHAHGARQQYAIPARENRDIVECRRLARQKKRWRCLGPDEYRRRLSRGQVAQVDKTLPVPGAVLNKVFFLLRNIRLNDAKPDAGNIARLNRRQTNFAASPKTNEQTDNRYRQYTRARLLLAEARERCTKENRQQRKRVGAEKRGALKNLGCCAPRVGGQVPGKSGEKMSAEPFRDGVAAGEDKDACAGGFSEGRCDR